MATRPRTLATPASPRPAPAPAAAPGAPGACADANLLPTPDDLDRVRAATMCLVNQVRAQHGLDGLQKDPLLLEAAQSHTHDMIVHDYFSHTGPAGDTPLDRMVSSGYVTSQAIAYTVGENIGWATLSLSTPKSIVAGWVASPEHLANILNAAYVESAIGVEPAVPSSLAQGQAGATYTQDFGVVTDG